MLHEYLYTKTFSVSLRVTLVQPVIIIFFCFSFLSKTEEVIVSNNKSSTDKRSTLR